MRKWIGILLLSMAAHGQPAWQPFRPEIFEQARKENRFVLPEMEAVWCHVMEETTYHDARVNELLQKRYIITKADADARPDLANRYEDYGWPASIVYSPEGKEIVRLQGYVPPERMAKILQGVIDDPSPIVEEVQLPPPAAGTADPPAPGARPGVSLCILRLADARASPCAPRCCAIPTSIAS